MVLKKNVFKTSNIEMAEILQIWNLLQICWCTAKTQRYTYRSVYVNIYVLMVCCLLWKPNLIILYEDWYIFLYIYCNMILTRWQRWREALFFFLEITQVHKQIKALSGETHPAAFLLWNCFLFSNSLLLILFFYHYISQI